MRRSSSPQNSVSLFPFLAVLICTMGALVLLLLGLTQSMRTQAAAAATQASTSDQPALPLASIRSIRPPAPPLPGDFDHEALSAVRADAEAKRESHWRAILAKAIADRDAVQEELNRRQARRAQLEADLKELENRLDAEAGQINAARVAVEVSAEQEQDLALEHRRLSEQIALTENKIDQTKLRQSTAPNEYAILAYDGRSGTQRRPIYIECTESGYRFYPENIFVGANELKGGSVKYNALVTGTRALLRYWTLKHARDPKRFHRPYVLLIVRPGGVYAYDMARQLLSRLETNFGYELVEDDIVLQKLPPDAQSVAVLKEAIALAVEMAEKPPEASSNSGREIQTWDEERGQPSGSAGNKSTAKSGEGRGPGDGRGKGVGGDVGGASGAVAESTGQRRGSKAGGIPDTFHEPNSITPGTRPEGGMAARAGTGNSNAYGNGNGNSIGNGNASAYGGGGGNGMSGQGGAGGRARPADLRGGRTVGDDAVDQPLASGDVVADGETGGSAPGRLKSLEVGGTQSPSDNQRGATPLRGFPGTTERPGGKPAVADDGATPESGANVTGGPTGPRRRSSKLKEPVGAPPADAVGYAEINPGEGDMNEESAGGTKSATADERPPQRLFPQEKPLSEEEGLPTRGSGGARGQPSNERQPIHKHEFETEESVGGTGQSLPGPRGPRGGGNGGDRNLIGLERKIPIRVERYRVVIGDEDLIEIPVLKKTRNDALVSQVTGAMRQVIDSWGPAPRKFYWIPAVRFEVTTAGNPVYERLRGAFERQKVKSTVDYVENSDKTPRQEAR